MNIKKQIKRVLEKTGWFPYPYYIYKFNKPYSTIKSLIKKDNPVIFDIGANTGTSINSLSQLTNSTNIYSFEPDPDTYARLELKWGRTRGVKTFNLALSDQNGSLEFFVTGSNLASSLLKPIDTGKTSDTYSIKDVILIESRTLDFFTSQHGINFIDFIKLDTQGSELNVLKGAQRLLNERAISLIYAEVEFQEIYQGQCLYHELAAFLGHYGFQLYSLYNISINKKGETLCADALFYLK